ncbi:MAG: spore coat protein CotJB [Clostridia bacterium]|nr:spore coat protein CotJB [Oscillospiraceae bacterium]MBQ3551642.1 spore coat protein CotJB [Clostridia bacterium]
MEYTKCELELAISEIQFICVELNLYLNTHPDDEAAKDDYNAYSLRLAELIDLYEANFSPLQNFGHSPDAVGCYVCAKWPWEL